MIGMRSRSRPIPRGGGRSASNVRVRWQHGHIIGRAYPRRSPPRNRDYGGWTILRPVDTGENEHRHAEDDVDNPPRIRDRNPETSLALIDLMMTGRGRMRFIAVSLALLVVLVAMLDAGHR